MVVYFTEASAHKLGQVMLRSVIAAGCAAATLLVGCAQPSAQVEPTPTPTPIAPSSPLASTTSTSATPPEKPELSLTSVSNFRDVAVGGQMARGVVFRSGKLQGLSDADERKLIAAGVTDVFDLRTDTVAKKSPDPAIDGVTHHLVNIFAVPARSFPELHAAKAAIAEREQLNRDFVIDPKQRERIGTLLRAIAEARGAVIIHCSEGKDRTGWASAMLQAIAGADRSAIVADYLRSNEQRTAIIERGIAEARKAGGTVAAEVARIRLVVADDYLLAGLNELTNRYGDVNGYLTKGLGLSEQTIARLRTRLLAA
ncbi:MAG: tyrosine-protein phosphatase [Micropruina sp.]|uniref:tyrosine-protein phosphatase n=1 Tax=Micropruina sp. TaxID=2737536 RepID=UPI0039E57A8F